MTSAQDKKTFIFALALLLACILCTFSWIIRKPAASASVRSARTQYVLQTQSAQVSTQTAVATQVVGLVMRYSTQTAIATIQTPTPRLSPTSTSVMIGVPISTKPPSAMDWYSVPVLGYILVNLRALAGGGNELIVALLTAIAMLVVTQFRRLMEAIVHGFGYLLSLMHGRNKDIRFEHEYLEWLISQHRHLGLLPAQVVARRWGERQQFVELEKIYVRLSLSSQAGDEQWANFDKDNQHRWRRIPGRILRIIRWTLRTFLVNQDSATKLPTIMMLLALGTLLGFIVASVFEGTLGETGVSTGRLLGLAIGGTIGLASAYMLLYGNPKERYKDAWLVSDAAYEPGSLGLIVDRYPRLILRGDPGSGKSTLLRYMAVTCARALRHDKKDNDSLMLVRSRLQWDHPPFPILIRLNRYSKVINWVDDRGLIDIFRDELPPDVRKLYPDGFFERQLKTRPCLILLDAFDELGSPATRVAMAQFVQGFLEVHGKPTHRMVVTTRVVGYEGQLDRLGFHIRTVQPLQDGEVRALIKQRYRAFAFIETSERSLSAARAIEQHLMDRADNLIEKVEGLPTLRQLATNPMLLSLIALVSLLKVELPDERVLLYRDCVEILTERWAEHKLSESGAKLETSSGLGLNQKILLLRDLAFAMQQRRENNTSQALISQKEACDLIASRLPELLGSSLPQEETSRNLEARRLAEGWLESVQIQSGILVAQGLDQTGETLIGFSHLTFQEYLAAIAIKEIPGYWSILQNNILNPAWHEVVLLYSVLIDNATSTIETLLDAPEQPAGLILAGHCLSEKVRKVDQHIQLLVLNQLKEVFFSSDPELVREVGEIFGSIGGSDLIRILIDAIEDGFVPRQLSSIHAVENIREDHPALDEIRQKLVNVLDAQYPLDVKIAASEALAHVGDPRFIHIEPVMISVVAREPDLQNRDKGFLKRVDDYIYLLSHRIVRYIFKRQLPEYEISRFPVTNLEYSRFVDEANGSVPQSWVEGIYPKHKASHPVQDISFATAHQYCSWLSRKTGKAYRLPTEWEWETAAAGPNDAEYPWGNDFDLTKCNTLESNKEDTTPVGTYFDIKSEAGLQDTCGNIQEATIGLSPRLSGTYMGNILGTIWSVILLVAWLILLFIAIFFIINGDLWTKSMGLGLLIAPIGAFFSLSTCLFWLYILSNGKISTGFVRGYWKGGAWNKPHSKARRYFRSNKEESVSSGFRVVRSLDRDHFQKIGTVVEKALTFPSSLTGYWLGIAALLCSIALLFNSAGSLGSYYIYRANHFMSMGDTQQALNLYKQAVRTYPRNVNIWNNVCWYGSVYGHVADVLYACDQAISLDPDNPSVRDSRGLVRALAGDYQGAIEDFTYFAEKSSVDERQVRLRILWIAQLKAGNNPFNQNTLNLLIRLYQDSLNPEVWDQLISS